jgi:hypothetical protein
MRCARHPRTETDLSCTRCGTPVCPRCLVHAHVGLHCRKCSPPPPRRLVRRFASRLTRTVRVLLIPAIMLAIFFGPRYLLPGGTLRQLPGLHTNPTYQLAQGRVNCMTYRDLGTVECAGVVQNISDRSYSDVQVEVTWSGDAGTLLRTDSAFIDLNPLPAGQSSPWKLSAPIQPTSTRFRTTFRDSSGNLAARPPTP